MRVLGVNMHTHGEADITTTEKEKTGWVSSVETETREKENSMAFITTKHETGFTRKEACLLGTEKINAELNSSTITKESEDMLFTTKETGTGSADRKTGD